MREHAIIKIRQLLESRWDDKTTRELYRKWLISPEDHKIRARLRKRLASRVMNTYKDDAERLVLALNNQIGQAKGPKEHEHLGGGLEGGKQKTAFFDVWPNRRPKIYDKNTVEYRIEIQWGRNIKPRLIFSVGLIASIDGTTRIHNFDFGRETTRSREWKERIIDVIKDTLKYPVD
jgi:hypothetical protein